MKTKNTEIRKVETYYLGFDITVEREQSLGGDELVYYSIFRQSDGWEMESSFTSGSQSIFGLVEALKGHVDDYIAHPEEYDTEDD